MKKRNQWKTGVFAFFLLSQFHLSGDDNSSLKNSYMVPTGRVILAPDDFADDIAVSSLVEYGTRNGRVGGTIAFQLDPCNRLKLSGEYLGQKLTYSYSSGKESHWVQQAAFGADYQLLVDKDCLRALDFNIYSSYAPSKRLKNKTVTFLNSSGSTSTTLFRRIAGSNAWGGSIGTVWTPTHEDLFNIDIDWDHVRYKRNFSREKTVSGVGGSFVFTHRFPCCVDLSLEGQFRKPFNYLGARVHWNSAFNNPQVSVALFGGHTRGKIKLPSSSVIGVELSYALAICEPRQRDCCPPLWNPCDLVTWAMDPAVYMPEVLAISEERFCSSPIITFPIPNQRYFPCNSFSVSQNIGLAPYFSSADPLTFSISIPNPPDLITITIDPQTGILTYFHPSGCDEVGPDGFIVNVTATSRCGSATQSFRMIPIIIG